MNDVISKILAACCAILFVLDSTLAVVYFCNGKVALGVWMAVCAVMVGFSFYLNVRNLMMF